MFRGTSGRVLFLAILTSALTGPGQTIGVSVFIDHFVADLGLSRSAVSAAYMVGTLTGALVLPMVGSFVDRRGVRLAQMIVGSLFVLALVNMSFVNGLVWLAVGFTGIRLLGQGSLSLISTVTVSIWFRERRGTAIGVFSVFSNALMVLTPVILAVVIRAVGWRNTWLIAAAAIGLTVVPIAKWGLRPLPAKRAENAAIDASTTVKAEPFDGSYTRGEAMHTVGFWILVAVAGSAGMMSTALNFHQIDLLGNAGLSSTAAAAMFAPQVLGSSLAGIAFGWVADRMNARFLPTASMVLLITAHLLASVVSPGAAVVAYAIALGAAGGAVRTVTAALLPAWFGTAHLGAISGSLTLFNVGASALGPVALALTQAWFGSYPPAVLLLALLPGAALLFSLGPTGVQPLEERIG
ncbi:MAG: MFS transporter [Acidimicrobiales bacterium]